VGSCRDSGCEREEAVKGAAKRMLKGIVEDVVKGMAKGSVKGIVKSTVRCMVEGMVKGMGQVRGMRRMRGFDYSLGLHGRERSRQTEEAS
jgi:hypothetical protein